MIWRTVEVIMAVVGTLTVVGLVLSKCGCLRGKVKRMACECGNAMEHAAHKVSDAISDCTDGN